MHYFLPGLHLKMLSASDGGYGAQTALHFGCQCKLKIQQAWFPIHFEHKIVSAKKNQNIMCNKTSIHNCSYT